MTDFSITKIQKYLKKKCNYEFEESKEMAETILNILKDRDYHKGKLSVTKFISFAEQEGISGFPIIWTSPLSCCLVLFNGSYISFDDGHAAWRNKQGKLMTKSY